MWPFGRRFYVNIMFDKTQQKVHGHKGAEAQTVSRENVESSVLGFLVLVVVVDCVPAHVQVSCTYVYVECVADQVWRERERKIVEMAMVSIVTIFRMVNSFFFILLFSLFFCDIFSFFLSFPFFFFYMHALLLKCSIFFKGRKKGNFCSRFVLVWARTRALVSMCLLVMFSSFVFFHINIFLSLSDLLLSILKTWYSNILMCPVGERMQKKNKNISNRMKKDEKKNTNTHTHFHILYVAVKY